VSTNGLTNEPERSVPEYVIYKNSDAEETNLLWQDTFTGEKIAVFIDLLMETENISPSRYVTQKIYFAMFPAAHCRQTPWKPACLSLQFKDHLMVS
jgi:hypothetical protein